MKIFERASTDLAGAFAADQGKLSFGAGVSTALVQNANIGFMQSITRLYEIGKEQGTSRSYYVGGRAQGTVGVARVLGPSSLMAAFYTKFGDVCNAKGNTLALTFDQLNCAGGSVSYDCKGAILTQIGISLGAQDMIVNENSQLMFTALEYTEGGFVGAIAGAIGQLASSFGRP